MSVIVAIPTTYKGIRFRSRLEAKWAATFDGLGWSWEYEPLDLNGWIPDFFIPTTNEPYLVEVKPATNFWQTEATRNKIETALGFPAHSEDARRAHFHGLGYSLLIVPAFPLSNVEDYDPSYALGNEQLVIGWTLTERWGWQPDVGTYDPDLLAESWRAACNATQWRAPA